MLEVIVLPVISEEPLLWPWLKDRYRITVSREREKDEAETSFIVLAQVHLFNPNPLLAFFFSIYVQWAT